MSILPIYVHLNLGYSPTIVGLIISAQYVSTLLTRTQAGRMADAIGAKQTVLIGLVASAASGVSLAAAALDPEPLSAMALLVLCRLILGFAESWVSTGSMLWGIGRVGAIHTTGVISWNGIATYGALAAGAPTGILLERLGGMPCVGVFIAGISVLGFLGACRLRPIGVIGGEKMSIRQVFWRVTPHGMGLALGGVGFGVIAAFITLFYASRHWPNGALSLSVFGGFFIVVRLLFSRQIDRKGGFVVAIVSFVVETIGLALLSLAGTPTMALIGAALVGCGFSLIFPALGVEAVKLVAPSNRGAALGAYSVFIDVSMGLSGPLAGVIIAQFGYPEAFAVATVASAGALVLSCFLRARFNRT